MSQPAGWYPQHDGSQRYWDGQSWTSQVAPPPPPQPGGAPMPPLASPEPPKKHKKPIYKRVWFWFLVVVVVLIIVISSALSKSGSSSGGNQGVADQSVSAQKSQSKPTQEKTAGIGDTVRVGDLAVTVTGAERTTHLSNVLGSKDGNWMLVTVTLANDGKKQITVDDSDFTLLEPDGTSYGTDSDGMTYIDSNDSLFLKQINPKTSATGKMLFSIPKSAAHLTLQASGGLFGTDSGKIPLGDK